LPQQRGMVMFHVSVVLLLSMLLTLVLQPAYISFNATVV
jgi:hypothetical protein